MQAIESLSGRESRELPFRELLARASGLLAAEEGALVVGCGPSAEVLQKHELELEAWRARGGLVFGVNDAARFAALDVLLLLDVLDPEVDPNPLAFSSSRAEVIRATAPRVGTFTLRKLLPTSCPGPIAGVSLQGQCGAGACLDEAEAGLLSRGLSSVFSCCSLAYAAGARRIGVVGCELEGHHLFGRSPLLERLRTLFWDLEHALEARGCTLRMLSPSLLEVKREELGAWLTA